MKNLIEFILIHLVENPDQVRVDHEKQGERDIYTIHVAPEDMGRVIGKNGKIINAIRSITRVRAIKEGLFITVGVAESETETAPTPVTE